MIVAPAIVSIVMRMPFSRRYSFTATSSDQGAIRSMTIRNLARRAVFPYLSNPDSVCCFIEVLA